MLPVAACPPRPPRPRRTSSLSARATCLCPLGSAVPINVVMVWDHAARAFAGQYPSIGKKARGPAKPAASRQRRCAAPSIIHFLLFPIMPWLGDAQAPPTGTPTLPHQTNLSPVQMLARTAQTLTSDKACKSGAVASLRAWHLP
ncbi:hypothetical protein Micbo1qcDRAFT_163597 [Microdochium bolleyi]|uniref:Uncharacterized protein n=1 Tax=Microdochium bolleyi TaxID=196109 RepID=A0A136J1D8_9PEZI|nr:hypothetical protein Micbo1qcDRAFT_163597 [Microdochium bolleyi]